MAAAPDCDVLVVGAGPTGATLALLLAREGLSVTLAERERDIYPLPRAAHIDHEALRIFQAVGLADAVAASSRRVARYDFLNRDRQVLLRFDNADAIGPGGWPASNMIHQPSIERELREALLSRPEIALNPAWELDGITSADGRVEAAFSTPDGSRLVSARFLVGADGSRSRVRELAGLGLEDLGFDEPWLVVDTLVRDAARLPEVNLQICDPERPTTCVLMGAGRHRWEFMIKPGETAEQVMADDFVEALLAPWDVAGAVEVERKAVYRFSARVAERWRADRVLVAGDAAHTMPPFAGQGLCSGLRDAANLAWKLAAAVRSDGVADRLLETYQIEREPHVRAIIDLATMMGRTVCTLDPAAASARDAQMIAAREAGGATAPSGWPAFAKGCVLAGAPKAGAYFPQVAGDTGAERLDDVLGAGAWLISRSGGGAATPGGALRSFDLADPALSPFRSGLEAWLAAAGAEAVLVRPDRHVFGAGRPEDLAAAYLSWISPGQPQGADVMPDEPNADPGSAPAELGGVYHVVVKSPLGDEALKISVTRRTSDGFSGTSEGDRGVNAIAGAVHGATLTWTEDVSTPFPITLAVTMTVAGDEVSGAVKAGAFGEFPLSGRRVGRDAASAAVSATAAAPAPASSPATLPAVEGGAVAGDRPSVFRLAYVDLTTPSLDDARAYYEGVLGLQPVETSPEAAFLSLGLDHHNLVLRQAARESLAVVGLQAAPHVPLADLRDRLTALGFAAELKSDARPQTPLLVEVSDVGGHRFQIVSETAVAAPRGESTGVAPLKLGHVAVLSPDPARLLAFLQQGLGFFATDWFDQLVTFVTCNQDHHVMNVAAAPIATLHHLAFLLGGADHQVRAADLLARHAVPTLWGPARHTAGHNIASYHHGADRALIELYNDMDVFSPELGYCEPRPWHGDRPQRPKRWSLTDMTRWNTRYEFAFSAVEFGVG